MGSVRVTPDANNNEPIQEPEKVFIYFVRKCFARVKSYTKMPCIINTKFRTRLEMEWFKIWETGIWVKK